MDCRGGCCCTVQFCKIVLQVLRGHYCLDYQYKSVPLLLPMCSGSGVDLPLLIFGLLMTSTITKMTLLSAFLLNLTDNNSVDTRQ